MRNRIKLILGIKDDAKDEVLDEIIELCKAPLLSYIGESSVPSQLDWLLIEMCVIRYNRLNSEGLNSESIEGGSVSFITDIFSIYKEHLDIYIANKSSIKKGAVFY